MTIRHLRIFIEVAETGKMSAAADKLYITQPSVSQAIRELEEHYHVLLFERLNKRLYITPSGKSFYNYAKQVISHFDFMEEHMSKKLLRENLRIGATISVGGSILSNIVRDFRAKAPDVDTYAYVANSRIVEEKLLKMELDVGIMEGTAKSPDLVSIPLIDDFLVLVCGKHHPFYQRDFVSVGELQDQEFVMRETGSGTRELFENFLDKHHVDIRIVFEENTPDSIRKALTINNCLGVISARLIEDDVKSGNLYPFLQKSREWNRSFKFVYHKNKFLSESILLLQDIVKSYGDQTVFSQVKAGVLTD